MQKICKCCNCGRIFYENELVSIEESRGEFWGFPAYETCYYSPCCEEDWEYVDEEEIKKINFN